MALIFFNVVDTFCSVISRKEILKCPRILKYCSFSYTFQKLNFKILSLSGIYGSVTGSSAHSGFPKSYWMVTVRSMGYSRASNRSQLRRFFIIKVHASELRGFSRLPPGWSTHIASSSITLDVLPMYLHELARYTQLWDVQLPEVIKSKI